MKHDCVVCRHMKLVEECATDAKYVCMFPHSPKFLQKVTYITECELEGKAEQRYQELGG